MRQPIPSRRDVLRGLLAVAATDGERIPARDDTVGRIGLHTVQPGDTLVDIAVQWRVGYVELVAANPEVDPWLPDVGTELVVPDLHILPDAPRRGIVINLSELRLYHFAPNGRTVSMPIGIGSDGKETPLGETVVTGKRRNPTWWPPESIRAENPELPRAVPPGPDNPLGDYALDLGWPLYRIHGTNKPYGVGRRVSHGCIRMYPDDIETLFGNVPVGTPVRVVDQPVKIGWSQGQLLLEVHPTQQQADAIEAGRPVSEDPATIPSRLIFTFLAVAGVSVPIRWPIVVTLSRERRGIPGLISDTDTAPPR